ncbi:MAG: hypothetical protein FWC21_01275 [Treponema sp.]|nr:hypothetical protein [Treponema sp.]
MDLKIYNDLTGKFTKKIENLTKQKKFVIGNINKDASEAREKAAAALLRNDWLLEYPFAVCVDIEKAVSLYLSLDGGNEEKTDKALSMARVNFMGTDGARGRVSAELKENVLIDFFNDNAFTPDFAEITSFAFLKLLLDNDIIAAGDTVIIGNDGRDEAYNWVLNNSVRSGFTKADLNVLDLGVAPTAVIPRKNLQLGHRAGACLTASHNPSNQNGIKYFIDGKKLVPEGALGDYALSAYMYNYSFIEKLPLTANGKITEKNVTEDSADWMIDVLGSSMKNALKDTTLIFDSANGASDTTGKLVLDKLGARYISVNEKSDGGNINRGCGVAEIEGTEYFKGIDYSKHINTIKKIFDEGRKSSDNDVYGIAVDGDGDRGFVLFYSKKEDIVYVLDGDKCGYIIADYLIKSKNLNAKDFWFLSTIESDIMTSSEAKKNLGLKTEIVSVGDKWIGNFKKGNALVGLEISGHVIFPIEVARNKTMALNGTAADQNEKKQILLSGVGLLTGLMTIQAIKRLNLSEEKIIKPFEPGFSKTYYIFFIDKTMFYRDGALWNMDKKIAEDEIKKAAENKKLPRASVIKYEDKEDLNVLYLSVYREEELIGVLFTRNSGTEDKNAVYVKGRKEYEDVLCEIGAKIQKAHAREMKNKTRAEYKYEQAIINNLEMNNGKTTVDSVLSDIKGVSETDLFSVIHGLKKEGRINVTGREINYYFTTNHTNNSN